MDMSKRGRMPKHLNVHCSYQVLFEIFGSYVFFSHAGLEGLKLIEYNFIFLLFGFGLSDTFYEFLELFGKMTGSRCHSLS